LSPVGELPDEPPPRVSGISPSVNARVERSTVLVRSHACGWVVRGTGWVAGNGIVVTSAHVVLGERETIVEDAHGQEHDGRVIAFDPEHDLALLRVAQLRLGVLTLADAVPGEIGAVYGHPGGGALDIVPALVGETSGGRFDDVYKRGAVDRRAVTFVGAIAEGYSGGPLVNQEGRVLGVVFSHRKDDADVGYAIPTDDVSNLVSTQAEHPKAVRNRTCAIR
jgi:S1-C subfamily serine protease